MRSSSMRCSATIIATATGCVMYHSPLFLERGGMLLPHPVKMQMEGGKPVVGADNPNAEKIARTRGPLFRPHHPREGSPSDGATTGD